MNPQVEEALFSFHETNDALKCCQRLARAARNELLDALHIPSRYSTLGRNSDERSTSFRKADVDYTGCLSPSQRRRMRLLNATMKVKK